MQQNQCVIHQKSFRLIIWGKDQRKGVLVSILECNRIYFIYRDQRRIQYDDIVVRIKR
jgi:hypothetical protein